MPHLDSFDADYLRLTLEIHKHIDGYTEGYYGPAELRAEVEATPPLPAASLLAGVQRLQDSIPTADPARAAYLTATLRAIECTVHMLAGETFDYLDEVARIYDIQPRLVAEERFTAAHHALDTLLPGGGPLGERLAVWRKGFEIDTGHALALLELARAETRRRTAAFIDLPNDESVTITLVQGQAWSAYNWYLGGGRSLIEFNTDIPLSALALLGTFAHEGYPGHHTEGMLKEIALFRGRGYGEQAVSMLHSPAAVISEGIATTALDVIFPDDSHYAWTTEVLLPAAGLPVEAGLAARLQAIAEATAALRYVSANAAILYHTGQLDRPATLDYIQAYALSSAERAAQSFSFISHPLYRSYPFTYTTGYDLIAAAGDRDTLFRRLLTKQVLPSQLSI